MTAIKSDLLVSIASTSSSVTEYGLLADNDRRYKNHDYDHRYDADAERMQSRINRFKEIKRYPAERDIARREKDVEDAERSYNKKVSDKEREIARLQQEIEKLKADKNNDYSYSAATRRLETAKQNLAQQQKDLADIKAGKWSIDDLKTESLKKKKKKLTESYHDNANSIILDSVDTIVDAVRDGADLDDAIHEEIDSHCLIYTDDIVDLARYYNVVDTNRLSDDVYEPLFDDLYSRVSAKL